MTEFKINTESMKSLIDELTPFSGGKTSVSITIGFQTGKDGRIPSTATIVNGGNMLVKGFFALGEDKTKCTVAFDAGEFIKLTSGLLAFNESIKFTVSESGVKLAAGEFASIQLPLLAENETPLPYDLSKTNVALLIDTNKFLSLAHKGCFLHDDNDQRNIADRIVIKLTLTGDGTMRGYSMDGHAFSTALISLKPKDVNKPSGYIIKPNWQISILKEMADKLPEKERDALNKRIQEAEEALANKDSSLLLELCKKESVDTSEYKFSLLYSTFELMKKVVKGTTVFQIALTDTYCIVRTSNTTAVFTLGSTVPTFYDTLVSYIERKPLAEVVIDTQAFLKGLSLMLLNPNINNKKEAILIKAESNSLILSYGESTAKAKYVEKSGAIGSTSLYMMATLLKKVVSNMDNGNLYLSFYDTKSPILIRNGTIKTESRDFVFVLPVRHDAELNEENEDEE